MENKEIELKFEVNAEDIPEFFRKFRVDFNHRFSGYEKSEMYDLDGLLDKNDARLRLRKTINLEDNSEIIKLTYKKPLTREGIKVEIEHETKVESYDKMAKILESMGFKMKSSYEKIRHSFSHGKELIEIDIYPFASFIEIEGAEKEILTLANTLGFEMKDNLTDSCDTIDDNRRKEQGLPSRDHINFENLEATTDAQREIIKNNQK